MQGESKIVRSNGKRLQVRNLSKPSDNRADYELNVHTGDSQRRYTLSIGLRRPHSRRKREGAFEAQVEPSF